MKIYEYQAKEIFKKNGISVPINQLIENGLDAERATENINKSVVLKSQVLVGGGVNLVV